MKEYIIKCRSCNATFDVKEEMINWQQEMLIASEFMEKVKELNSYCREKENKSGK